MVSPGAWEAVSHLRWKGPPRSCTVKPMVTQTPRAAPSVWNRQQEGGSFILLRGHGSSGDPGITFLGGHWGLPHRGPHAPPRPAISCPGGTEHQDRPEPRRCAGGGVCGGVGRRPARPHPGTAGSVTGRGQGLATALGRPLPPPSPPVSPGLSVPLQHLHSPHTSRILLYPPVPLQDTLLPPRPSLVLSRYPCPPPGDIIRPHSPCP